VSEQLLNHTSAHRRPFNTIQSLELQKISITFIINIISTNEVMFSTPSVPPSVCLLAGLHE